MEVLNNPQLGGLSMTSSSMFPLEYSMAMDATSMAECNMYYLEYGILSHFPLVDLEPFESDFF